MIEAFAWLRQAPFACALYTEPLTHFGRTEFVTANAVFSVVTGMTQQQLHATQAEDFTLRAVYYSPNTGQQYQVHSYSPVAGYLLVVMQQLPHLYTAPQPQTPELASLSILMLDIAQRFISVTTATLSAEIQRTLALLGQALAADRVYIFDYDFSANTCSNTYEWCRDGIAPEIANLQLVPLAAIPQWVNAHLRGNEMHIPDVPSLSEHDALKQILQPQGIKSLLTLPILDATPVTRREVNLIGFIGFDAVIQHHYFSEQERLLLGTFAQMLLVVQKKYRNDSEISETLV